MTSHLTTSGTTREALAERLPGPTVRNGAWLLGFCPAHADGARHDRRGGQSLGLSDKGVLTCFAGCSRADVYTALGIEDHPGPGGRPVTYRRNRDAPEQSILRWYDYADEGGQIRYIVGRTPAKDFPVYHLESEGWRGGFGGQRILYRLPELAIADPSAPILLCEGEKDADRARAEGLIATTTPAGAGKASHCDLAPLTGRPVVIVPDKDEPGRKHSADLRRLLGPIAASVQILELPAGTKKDLSDFFDAGGSAGELLALVGQAATLEAAGSLTRFKTAREISASLPDEPEAIIRGVVYVACLTELTGKVKGGKSTLLGHLAAAILERRPFLGFETSYSPIVYLTEERAPTFRALLGRVGLADRDDLHVLSLVDAGGLSWAEVVALAEAKAKAVGARILIVDTLSRWAKLPEDSENSAGAAAAAMEPLEAAAGRGLAVLVVRHDRKGGGELGESARGSSAFSGSADVLLSLRRANVEGHESRRVLLGVGRFDDVPSQLTLELRDGAYVVLGDSAEVERAEAKAKLLDTLPGPDATALTEPELIEQLRLSRSTFHRARDELLADRKIEKVAGMGKTGRAFGYRLSKSTAQYTYDPEQSISNHGDSHLSDSEVANTTVQAPLREQLISGNATVQPSFPNGQSITRCADCAAIKPELCDVHLAGAVEVGR